MSHRLNVIAKHLTDGIAIQKVCGIIGVVSYEPVSQYLIDGLRIMEARGYDSAGITTLYNGNMITTKFASNGSTCNAVDLVANKIELHQKSLIGIAHTRWATHGSATDINSHPHLDQDGRIAVVHNGVIENYSQLKEMLIKEHNLTFKSDTDTEVIAQLIGLYIKQNMSIEESVIKTTNMLKGTWGLCILDRENPESLIVCKNGSPMLIGISEDKTFVVSEIAAFGNNVHKYLALEDKEIVILHVENNNLDISRIHQNNNINSNVTTPCPYKHWTLREIYEQPESIMRALNIQLDEKIIINSNHLIIVACGSSLYAGLFVSHIMRILNSFTIVEIIDAAEFDESNLIDQDNITVLVISQSGETKDTHRALELAKSKNIFVVSIVNVVDSLIARSANSVVYINAGRENAVASTKSFTSQTTVLTLLAIYFSKSRNNNKYIKRLDIILSLHKLPETIKLTLDNVNEKCKKVALKLFENKVEHIFILGKGSALPISLEGALKIKEISYVHAEGFSGGALKHGPFALLDNNTTVMFIILNDKHKDKMKVAIEEVSARGSNIIIITDIQEKFIGDVILIPSNGILTSLSAIIPIQLIAYELSILKNINPDRPRNLAKTITVD
jgi:glutamine---fructose-6-phosphate transaminase (isomerizing)